MPKFGSNFLRKESVTEKFANLLDISPSDVKGKHSFGDVVSNIAAIYKHSLEHKMPEKVINNSGINTYKVIGYDLELSKKLEERSIKVNKIAVGTNRLATEFRGDMVSTHLPQIYTDEEGNIWQYQNQPS